MVVTRWRWDLERGMFRCLWIWLAVSCNRVVSVVPRSVVSALRCVPKSRMSFKTWMHLPIGVHTRDRRVERVMASEEKVIDLEGGFLRLSQRRK